MLESLANSLAEVSWSIILAVASIHSLFPSARRYTRPFYQLPYPDVDGQYLQGSEDALFVLGWLVLMTAIRATLIESVYQAATCLGPMSKKTRIRFAEQGFLLFYYGTSFSTGMVCSTRLTLHYVNADKAFTVPPRGLLLLAQFRRTLVHLALAPDIRRIEMVLPRPTLILATTDPRHQHGEATQRLRSNVHPPCRDQYTHVYRIHLSLDKGRPRGSHHHGCGRLSAASK